MKQILFIISLFFFVLSCNEKDTTDLCEIDDVVITVGKCTSDSTYELTIDFKTNSLSSSSFNLFVRQNRKIGNFKLSNLPLKISNFTKSGKEYDYIKICVDGEKDCCKEYEFKPPICDDCPCEIYDLVVETGDCNSDSTYELWLDFEVKNPENESFDLYTRNGKFIGNYKLNKLPLKLEKFEKSGFKDDYLKVCINDNKDCCKAIEFEPPKCNCKLEELTLTAGDCTSDSTYKLTIDFKYENISNDYFDVFVRNNKHIGYYKFTDLPITIDSFVQSGKDWDYIKVCENDNNDCCIANEVKSPNCK